jgi:peptide subunit release factor 1 (eRF1)
MRRPPQGKERTAVLRKVSSIDQGIRRNPEKRQKIQESFWNQVGSAEHINLPKLEDAFKNVIQHVKMQKEIPENGLAIFAGTFVANESENEVLPSRSSPHQSQVPPISTRLTTISI